MGDDSEKLADALGTIGTPEDSPEQPQIEEEGPGPSPAPPPAIEAFVEYRRRIDSDTDGYIGSALKEWHATLPEDEQRRLESDIDFFNASWDRFEACRPPRPAPAPAPQEPPPPREYIAPPWKAAQIAREARQSKQVVGPWTTIAPGLMPDEGTGQRVAAEKHARTVNLLRQRVAGGDKDAEVALAQALGLGNLGKPSWGPERY